ncbi:MAG: zinc ribbon domain-containing protein [Bacteroidaceae bacterium]|nr:zinc ribbon domain-containing protein [Bacteroidaceae bacterium]
MMYCRYCGFQLTDNAHFCTKCGKAVVATAPPPPRQQTPHTAPPIPPNSAPQNNQTTPPPTSRPFNPQATAPTPPPTNLRQTAPPPVTRQTPPQPGPATPPPVNTPPPTNGYSPQDIQQGVQKTFNSIHDIIAQLSDNDIKASATGGEIVCTSSPAQNAFLRLLRKGSLGFGIKN